MKPFSQGIRGKRLGEAKTAPPPVLPLLPRAGQNRPLTVQVEPEAVKTLLPQRTTPVSFAGLEKKSLRASEQDRPDVARHRSRWRVWQRYMDAERFVFIDETAATTAMTRLYGWSPRGERLVVSVPGGHWETPH